MSLVAGSDGMILVHLIFKTHTVEQMCFIGTEKCSSEVRGLGNVLVQYG